MFNQKDGGGGYAKEPESNDILTHFVERPNMKNSDRNSNATQSKPSHKAWFSLACVQTLLLWRSLRAKGIGKNLRIHSTFSVPEINPITRPYCIWTNYVWSLISKKYCSH